MSLQLIANCYRVCLDVTMPLVVLASTLIGNQRAVQIVSVNGGALDGLLLSLVHIHYYMTIGIWCLALIGALVTFGNFRRYVGSENYETVARLVVVLASDAPATLFWCILVLGLFQGEFFLLLTPIIVLEASAVIALVLFIGSLETKTV